MTGPTPSDIERRLDDLADEFTTPSRPTLVVNVPERAEIAPEPVAEWWATEADHDRYTVTKSVGEAGVSEERVATPQYLPAADGGVLCLSPSERAHIYYEEYTDDHREAERAARREAGDPVPPILEVTA
jgi:hypothetical protein